jgi:two-component system, OmpR family, sensor histidine kinase QseC
MTLRLRLLLTIGASFALFWTISSLWMFMDLRAEFRDALDERLAASANMVAALVADSPLLAAGTDARRRVMPQLAERESVACEIRLMRGEIVGRTSNSPAQLGVAEPGYRTRIIDGTSWRSFTLVQNGIRITTADRLERRELLLRDIAVATFVPFAIAMVASLFALWFAIRRGLVPLESIRAALAARAPDALQPLPEQGLPGELRPLVVTVNTLLARIDRAIERERRFTGDAAHELRTPLTAVKTHIQVARLAGCPPEADTSLAQAEQGVRRLHNTIDQLLLLARLEGPFSFDDGERIDAGAAAHEALKQFPSELAKRVTILDQGAGPAVLDAPASLAITALRNVIDNALRHGGNAKIVAVRLQRGAGTVSFVVEDEGAGMDAQDIDLAAQRFWRKGRGAGSGLGLSIVDAIVTRHGGSWELAARASGGLTARMTLPAV